MTERYKITPNDSDDPADSKDAFRPSSPWWGAMLCPAAMVVGRMENKEIGMTERYKQGDVVIAIDDIWEECCEDRPHGLLAARGDELIVRHHFEDDRMPLSVHHSQVTDGSFRAELYEVRKKE